VQTDGVTEARVTGNPELADALTVNGATPYGTPGRAGKVIVCENNPTVTLCGEEVFG
jgi:hypothetical protein